MLGLCLALVCAGGMLLAGNGKGGGGGNGGGGNGDDPPAAGTIFFSHSGDVYGMNSDGSNVTLVIPASVASECNYSNMTPSTRVYGEDNFFDRWWLAARDYGVDPVLEISRRELIAFQIDADGNVTENELTNAFSQGFLTGGAPAWGPNDDFISVKSTEFGYDPDQGSPFAIANHAVRLDVSGDDILFATGDLKIEPTSTLWSVVATINNGYEGNFRKHDWGPAGEMVLYSGDDDVVEGSKEDLFLRDTDTGIVTKLWDNSQNWLNSFDWSPDGTLVALDAHGEIQLLDTNGVASTLLFNGRKKGYRYPQWSPDSSQLLLRKYTEHGGVWDSTTSDPSVGTSDPVGTLVGFESPWPSR